MLTRIMTAVFAVLVMATSSFAADIDGEWNVMLSASEGSTSIPLTIKVDGETATADADGDKLTGTYIDGELKLEGSVYIAEAGFAENGTIVARLNGDALEGTMDWGGYSLSMYGSK